MALLFDLDGTLVDSIDLIRRSWRHTVAVHGHEPPSEAFWLEGLGRPLAWQFERFSDDPDEVAAMIRTYRAWNARRHDALLAEYAGVQPAIAELRRRGAALAIVTSKAHAGALRALRVCRMEGWFPVVVGADDVRMAKPHAEPVLTALERLGASAASSWMIGDSPHDLASGRAAGVPVAAVAWGPFPEAALRACAPDRWLRDPAELLELA